MLYYVAGYDTLPATSISPRPDWAGEQGISFNPNRPAVYAAGKHSVRVLDAAGKTVARNAGSRSVLYDFTEELRDSPGLYIVQVTGPSGSRSRKYLVN
jgi:hypothetical protein